MKKVLVLILCFALSLSLFTGCHGAKRMDAFVIPEEFDTTREYTVTFWAKSDTNITQTNIYKKAIADFSFWKWKTASW